MAKLLEQETIPFARDSKLLLHSCCAPCSGSMIKVLVEMGIQVTILWYNPNIHPRAEYEIRKQENLKYALKLGIPFVDLDYDTKEWFSRAKGMELDPERGSRCTMCFDMRMERTALYASENDFHWFTTTNATSRWKDVEQVNGSGRKAAERYENVHFWEFNWQTDRLTQLKYEVSAENSFYKQEYCGCAYSLRDTNAYRKLNNQPPVVIGGGGVFSDPLADAAEESQENVDAFFQTANTNLQELYSNRRKYNTKNGDRPIKHKAEVDSGVETSCGRREVEGGKLSCDLNNW
jgi:predicted adenine nucleotide alpha hydrolase (AANH) superfamily ATPase